MILVDSSAWVEYDRATGSALDERLTALIAEGGAEVAVTEPVLMEVLAGARDERRRDQLRNLLTSFEWLRFDAVTDFEGAERIYRGCRANGFSPRSFVDCMIANVALRTDAAVLAVDRDFAQIAGVHPIRLDAA